MTHLTAEDAKEVSTSVPGKAATGTEVGGFPGAFGVLGG